jgi:hypothetical protein
MSSLATRSHFGVPRRETPLSRSFSNPSAPGRSRRKPRRSHSTREPRSSASKRTERRKVPRDFTSSSKAAGSLPSARRNNELGTWSQRAGVSPCPSAHRTNRFTMTGQSDGAATTSRSPSPRRVRLAFFHTTRLGASCVSWRSSGSQRPLSIDPSPSVGGRALLDSVRGTVEAGVSDSLTGNHDNSCAATRNTSSVDREASMYVRRWRALSTLLHARACRTISDSVSCAFRDRITPGAASRIRITSARGAKRLNARVSTGAGRRRYLLGSTNVSHHPRSITTQPPRATTGLTRESQVRRKSAKRYTVLATETGAAYGG